MIDSVILNESNDVSEITPMDALTASEAKTHFGAMLLKAQRAPIQINKNGAPVAVVISMEEYESIEALKLRLLQSRIARSKADIEAGNTVDGELFFDGLENAEHD